jgi:ABC-type glycerol-3-phosphate transport system substrate-binding protein
VTVLDEFAAEYKALTGLPVELVPMNGATELTDRLTDTSPAEWPNVVLAPDSMLRSLHDSARFLAPAECGDARIENLLPAVRAHFQIGGALAAVPFGVSTLVLMFDRVEYAGAGLDPDQPLVTFDDLLTASERVRISAVSPHGLVVDDHCIEWGVNAYSAMRGDMLSPPADGHDDSAIDVTYVTPSNVETLTALQDAVKSGDVVYIGNNEATFEDLSRIIAVEDGGTMALHTSATLGDLIGLFANGNFPNQELGVLPMPGPGQGGVAGGNALFLPDHGDPQLNGAGWDLIAWLTAPAQLAQLDAATGYLPPDALTAAEPALLESWTAHPELRVGYDQLLRTQDGPAAGGLLIGPTEPVNAAGYAACDELLADVRPPSDVLTDFQDIARGLIATYRPTN